LSDHVREWTFALVDLAGFSALTEWHGDDLAADLAADFADIVEQQLGPADQPGHTTGEWSQTGRGSVC
jgi:hypothetical protein